MGDLDSDTRVEGADGRYTATLERDWEIWGPNGGYLAVIALRAAGVEAAIPRPAVFSCHYLRVAEFGRVELEVVGVQRGRRAESFRVSMTQKGKPVLEALVRTAALGPGLEHDDARAPQVAPPDDLPCAEDLMRPDAPRHAFWKNFDVRVLHPERFREEPRVSREPVWHEWYRFRPRAAFDDAFTDAGRLLLLVDTLGWPAAVQRHPEPGCLAPSLDAVCWFHRDARDCDWLLGDHDCRIGAGGLLGTTGRIWSRDGRLLASGGAQLLCTPLPAARG